MSLRPPPVLRDGEVVLRPGTVDDAGAARLPPHHEIPGRVVSFLIEQQARITGSVEVRQEGDGSGELSWAVLPGQQGDGEGVGARAVRLVIGYAFEELGMHRVVAYLDKDDRESLRTAGRVGLRREGIARNAWEHRGQLRDQVQLARLVTDPEPTSHGGFIAVLNAGLPTKRVISQGLIRNSAQEILMCELTYKLEWDLPGGVVDPDESPADAVVREIREEMQVAVSPRSLVAVNWLPPWGGWDDATLLVFDLGVDDEVVARSHLEPREVRSLHWCTPERVERHAAPYVTRMMRRLALRTEGTVYLEDGTDPNW